MLKFTQFSAKISLKTKAGRLAAKPYKWAWIKLKKGEECVPTISIFFGIVIQMFWDDHAPPHFHARYAEYKCTVDIQKLVLLEGDMPRRALNLILDWAELHQQELLEDWELCIKQQTPNKIEPLK